MKAAVRMTSQRAEHAIFQGAQDRARGLVGLHLAPQAGALVTPSVKGQSRALVTPTAKGQSRALVTPEECIGSS